MKIHHSSNGTGQSVPQVSQARYSEQQSLKWIDSGHILLHLHSKQIAGEPERTHLSKMLPGIAYRGI